MSRFFPKPIYPIVVAFVLSLFYWSGIDSVPFHPDESTQIFMSQDLSLLINDPLSLAWSDNSKNDLRQNYRLLDAPLTRYIIGSGLWMMGLEPVKSDWDWSKNWEDNLSLNSYPSFSQLMTSRWSVAIFFPLSLILIYYCAAMIGNRLTGYLSMLLISTNSLVLIHTRRAMAESGLLFCVLLFLWAILTFRKHLWILAIPLALTVNFKQTGVALIFGGIFRIAYSVHNKGYINTRLLIQFSVYIGLFLLITFLLNPFMWTQPFQSFNAALSARNELTQDQTSVIFEKNPEKNLNSISKRTFAILAHLYVTAPAISDVANYQNELQSMSVHYLKNPLHSIFRSIWGGSIMLSLTLFGIFVGLIDVYKHRSKQQNILIFLFITNLFQFLFLVFIISLPFQRYVIPLVPFSVLWSTYGITCFVNQIKNIKFKKISPSLTASSK